MRPEDRTIFDEPQILSELLDDEMNYLLERRDVAKDRLAGTLSDSDDNPSDEVKRTKELVRILDSLIHQLRNEIETNPAIYDL